MIDALRLAKAMRINSGLFWDKASESVKNGTLKTAVTLADTYNEMLFWEN